jgi:D-hexose-6-phosphate mutarotase
MPNNLESLQAHAIPGRVAVATGNGGLPKLVVTAQAGTAEIYPHGAHVTHFQKAGDAPLLFLSRQSWFAPGKPIRGGIPICFPWFGNREGEPSHGFARITTWQLVKTAATPDGAVALHFSLPLVPGREAWHSLRAEFVVTVADTLTLELAAANDSCGAALEIENCLHTYFNVGDIAAVSIAGLQDAAFLDNAAGGHGARSVQTEPLLRIPRETNRLYLDTTAAVEIRDERLRRVIRVEKHQSQSTVVWNPWTTQKLPDDFDPAEHAQMVCVEAGNVNHNRFSLAPGQSSALKVVLHTRKL